MLQLTKDNAEQFFNAAIALPSILESSQHLMKLALSKIPEHAEYARKANYQLGVNNLTLIKKGEYPAQELQNQFELTCTFFSNAINIYRTKESYPVVAQAAMTLAGLYYEGYNSQHAGRDLELAIKYFLRAAEVFEKKLGMIEQAANNYYLAAKCALMVTPKFDQHAQFNEAITLYQRLSTSAQDQSTKAFAYYRMGKCYYNKKNASPADQEQARIAMGLAANMGNDKAKQWLKKNPADNNTTTVVSSLRNNSDAKTNQDGIEPKTCDSGELESKLSDMFIHPK